MHIAVPPTIEPSRFQDDALLVGGPLRKRRAIETLAAALCLSVLLVLTAGAEERPPHEPSVQPVRARNDVEALSRLHEAVADGIARNFWDTERLARVGWPQLAAERRAEIVSAPDLAEAATRINALLSMLETSHTALVTPDDADYPVLVDVFRGNRELHDLIGRRFGGGPVAVDNIGLFATRIEGRDFIDGLLEDSSAEKAGLRIGDEIVHVDGAPFSPLASFRGKSGETVRVGVRRSREGPVEDIGVRVRRSVPHLDFRAATTASRRIIERNGARVAYVHAWSTHPDSEEAFADAIAWAGRPPQRGEAEAAGLPAGRPRADALIVDMRGRIGGTVQTVRAYLNAMAPRGPQVETETRSGKHEVVGAARFRGRTVMLIDHRTRSASEIVAHSFAREGIGKLFGTPTAGAVTAGRVYAMPLDTVLYVGVAGLTIDGERIEGRGVAPDVRVERAIPYSGGADPVLEAALEHLSGR